MEKRKFYTPDEIRPRYGEIIPAYQSAFAGEPWYEVSKCVDEEQRCPGGLSPCPVGSQCDTCMLLPTLPAYETDEMVVRFDTLAATRDMAWYAEEVDENIAMAAFAWNTAPQALATERYGDVPAMAKWIPEQLNTPNITWIDEVFANRNVRSEGNLRNFGSFVIGLADRLKSPIVAYRTISPQMVRVATRDFGEDATVFERNIDVPDRRDFIVINLGEEE